MEGENWKIAHPLKTFYQGNKKGVGRGDLTPRPPHLVYATDIATGGKVKFVKILFNLLVINKIIFLLFL